MQKYLINLHYHVVNPLEKALDYSDIKEELMKVKHGEYSFEEVNNLCDSEFQIFTQSNIPYNHGKMSIQEVQNKIKNEFIKYLLDK